MSLSPYINPTNLNGALVSTSKVGEYLYGTDEFDALDKRNTGAAAIGQLSRDIVSSVKDVTDTIMNIRGMRSPMYRIGYIEKETDKSYGKKWLPDEVNGLIRAISSPSDYEQEGVIIDGIGDADGTLSIKFSSNPVLFRATQVVDNRFREPAKLTMTIYVSNYLQDDINDVILDTISSLDPTGLLADAKNMLAYEGNTRAQYALYKLRHLMENAKPFSVYTPHGVYDNMLIKSIRPQTRDNTMDMLYCTIDFQEMILYTPLSGGVGAQPARKGVGKERAGWTGSAVEKTVKLFGAY